MSFKSAQLLEQSTANARQEKLTDDMYKLIQKLRGHITQTNCTHCKELLMEVAS